MLNTLISHPVYCGLLQFWWIITAQLLTPSCFSFLNLLFIEVFYNSMRFYVKESKLSISSNWVITVINANAAVTLLEQRPKKFFQALTGIRTHDRCDAGLTRIRPLSRGFDSSVGRALHRHRKGGGFESRSEPEKFFQVSVPVVLRPHLH